MLAAGWNENPEVITTLMKAGAVVTVRQAEGATPLMYAARFNRNPYVITALLETGADAKTKDKWGKTAFAYAQDDQRLKSAGAYWKLYEAQYWTTTDSPLRLPAAGPIRTSP